jgi:hypothetical protein
MRKRLPLVALMACLAFAATARAGDKPEYADLAKRIQEAVVAKMPRQYEDLSGWGKTIPPPPAVRFPRLKRTLVRVGDHYELPHGTWKRTRVWVNDPARDVVVQVTDARKVGKNTRRLRVEATVALQGERERKEWRNGVHLLGVTAQADAVVTVSLDVDVTVTLNTDKLTPEVNVNAKVADARLELRDFNVRRVGRFLVEAQELNEELRAAIQERMRAYEPQVKEYANRAIIKSIQSGKGLFLAPSRPKD